jgi:hypothetical protein
MNEIVTQHNISEVRQIAVAKHRGEPLPLLAQGEVVKVSVR